MKQLIFSICMSGLLFVSGGCSRLRMGQWEVHQKVDPLDDSRVVSMSLLAENKVGLTRPRLSVLCSKNSFVSVFINYGSFKVLGRPYENITVWTRFDQSPAEESRWIVLPGSKGMIAAPLGHIWAAQIASARKLFVRVIPESGRAVDATFQLEGSVEAMRPLRKACGW